MNYIALYCIALHYIHLHTSVHTRIPSHTYVHIHNTYLFLDSYLYMNIYIALHCIFIVYVGPSKHHLSRVCFPQGLAGAGYLATNAMYTVDAGHMSLKVGIFCVE